MKQSDNDFRMNINDQAIERNVQVVSHLPKTEQINETYDRSSYIYLEKLKYDSQP
jgi:hypothetical protein